MGWADVKLASIILIGGAVGTGKSFLCLHLINPDKDKLPVSHVIFDTENRWDGPEGYLVANGRDPEKFGIINLMIMNEDFTRDAYGTYQVWKKNYDTLFRMKTPPSVIIMDGISELKEVAVGVWMQRQSDKGKSRVRPQKYEWGEINVIRAELLIGLVNFCRVKRIKLVMTTILVPEYIGDEKTGNFIMDIPTGLDALVDEKIRVWTEKGRYYMSDEKNIHGLCTFADVTEFAPVVEPKKEKTQKKTTKKSTDKVIEAALMLSTAITTTDSGKPVMESIPSVKIEKESAVQPEKEVKPDVVGKT